MTRNWINFFQYLSIRFNVLLNYIDICNIADDTPAYICDVNLEQVLQRLEANSGLAIQLKDYMKLNFDKYRLIVSGQNMNMCGSRKI